MPTYSSLEIEFLEDLAVDSSIKILRTIDDVAQAAETWTFVATRSGAYEVTTGTPTGTDGEVTAQNFETAFDLDKTTGYVTTQTTNTVLIESETLGENFAGFKAENENGVPLVNGTDYNVTFDNYVPPLDLETVDRMLARSPYYVYTPFFFETTTDVSIGLKIYSGDYVTDEPASDSITITKIRPTVDYSEFNTNISQAVINYLESTPSITEAADIIDSSDGECYWVKYTATYTDPEEDIADITGYLIASDGYGYYSEGVNPTFTGVLTNCTRRKVDRSNGYILFPFVNDGDITNIYIESTPTNQVIDTLPVTTDDTTGSFVQYLQIDVSQCTTDTQISVIVTYADTSTDVFYYDITDECRYTPKTVIFKNKYGFFDTVTLFAKSKEDLMIEKDEFVNNYVSSGTYSTTKHQNQIINLTAKKSIICNSGHVKEAENTSYEELMLSEYVWFYEDGSLIPVKVSNNQFTYKTRINDSLIEYQVNFDYAYNLINNI